MRLLNSLQFEKWNSAARRVSRPVQTEVCQDAIRVPLYGLTQAAYPPIVYSTTFNATGTSVEACRPLNSPVARITTFAMSPGGASAAAVIVNVPSA